MSENPQVEPPTNFNPMAGVSLNILTIPAPSLANSRRNSMSSNHLEKKAGDEINQDDIDADFDSSSNIRAQEYFKEDPEQEPEEDENAMRKRYQNGKLTNIYESFFKPGVFFKFLFMHALFFCLLGPFIVILAPIFGWNVLYNQGFVGIQRSFFRQTAEFGIIISFLVIFYVMDVDGMQAIEIYMMFIAVLIRLIMISSKYAYYSPCLLKMLHNTILNKNDRDSELILGRWRLQTEDLIQEEIQAAIMRLEVDSPLFFFNFLGETSLEIREKLSKSSKMTKQTSMGKKGNENEAEESMAVRSAESIKDRNMSKRLSSPKSNEIELSNINIQHHEDESTPGARSVETIRERASNKKPSMSKYALEHANTIYNQKDKGSIVEEKSALSTPTRPLLASGTVNVFRAFSHFFDYQPLEEKSLYGYNIAFDLIKTAKKVRFRALGKLALGLSIFRALIPTLYRIYLISYKKEDIPLFTDKPYLVCIIFILNIFVFWANTFTLIQSVQAFKLKIWCFKQIGYLISPKKIHYFKERKLYPTLNIFDPITLKTWSSLRKIMREYGKKYFLRNNLNITIAMVFYFFVFCTLALQLLGVFTAYNDPLMFIVFGYETIIYFIIFFNVMTGAAFLNNQYKIHKHLLKKNKTIIADFQRLSYLYVGKEAIKPDNIIYKEGLKVLRNELGEDNFEEKLIERAEKLAGMIDDFIEELEFEEVNEPFTVMGVAVDYNFLKSLALGGISLAFAVGQSLANA